MTCTAHHCDTPTAEGITLCIDCVLKLEAVLDNAPDLLADAETTTARMDRIGRSEAGGGGSREGINIECMDRARELHELLVSWARLTLEECDERSVEVGHGLSPAELMRDHTGVIRLCDWAGDCLDELGRASRRLVQAVDVPPDYRTYGPCQVEGCDGVIRAPRDETVARCRACYARYDARELARTAIANSWDECAPLKRVVLALDAAGFPIPHRTLRSWVERGKLESSAVDERGRPLYSMAEVWRVRAEAA